MKKFSKKKTYASIGTLIVSRGMMCPCESYPAFSDKEQDQIDYIIAMLERMMEVIEYLDKQSKELSQSRDVDAQVQADIYQEMANMLKLGRKVK